MIDIRSRLTTLGLKDVTAAMPTEECIHALPWAKTLWVGLGQHIPYGTWPVGTLQVASHYTCYNHLYHGLRQLTYELKQEGWQADDAPPVAYKPTACQLGLGWIGRQSLLHHRDLGSYISLYLLATDQPVPHDAPRPIAKAPCEDAGCTLCRDVCPTGAVGDDGRIDVPRCLRKQMLSGQPVPEPMREKMGFMLLGCDLCQRVCPYNPKKRDEVPTELLQAGDLRALLSGPEGLEAALWVYEGEIGKNNARAMRILAQALLCAGNSGDPSLLTLVERYTEDDNAAVREHALWAKQRLAALL